MSKLALVSLFVLSGAVASADPHVAKVTSVSVGTCSTDGGTASCSAGVKYLGELIKVWFNMNLQDHPISCAADIKATNATIKLGYGYNEGQIFLQDSDKVQAKWPGCVKEFAKQSSGKLLEWWKILQPIDPTIDVNSSYKISISIKK